MAGWKRGRELSVAYSLFTFGTAMMVIGSGIMKGSKMGLSQFFLCKEEREGWGGEKSAWGRKGL